MDVTSSLRSLLPYGRRSIGINQLISKLETYLPPDQVELVQEAYDFAFQAHDGQRRRSGEPYITHPVAVADLLADLRLDAQTMMAAILHDVMEDTPNTKDEITSRFGRDVAELVDGVSKLDQIQFRSRAEAQAESFRKMLLAMVRDIRVIMVKLADRTHNMRTLGAMPPAKRRTIARETLEIYAPIANRLGMHAIKRELEDLGFRALYPKRYKVIESAVKAARGNHKQFVGRIAASLKEALDLAQIPASIEGREKDVYSIYEKMRRKKISLIEIVDVYGFRLVVDKADTCYRTLGVVHSVFKPMPGRFKDYIAIPRVNGYQSLHTTLFGPNGTPIEVQIRTSEMHRVAESGIAAHWQYKEGGGTDVGIQGDRAREWLQQLVEIQQGGNPEEFLESVKVDLFPDKVYVFTPKGEIRAPAAQLDLRRFRLCRAHRRRQPLRGGQGRSAPRAAAHAAAQRPDRRDHHGEGRHAEPGVGQFRRHREGARVDPPVPQEPEARRSDRPRQAPAEPGARGILADAAQDSVGGDRRGRRRTRPAHARRTATRRSASANASHRSSRAACCPRIPRA